MEQKPEYPSVAAGRGSQEPEQADPFMSGDGPLPRYGEGGRQLSELPGHLVRLIGVMISATLARCAESLAGRDRRRSG
jgi:hypothetical protein